MASRTFSSKNSRLDFEKMLEPGRLTIFRLRKYVLPRDFQVLLSAAVVLKVFFIVQKRARELEKRGLFEGARSPVILALDEFQNLARMEVIDTILSEAGKLGLYLYMVHQNLSQLRKELLDSLLGNMGSIIAMRLGPDDAARMAEVIEPGMKEEITDFLIKAPKYRSAVRTNSMGTCGCVSAVEISGRLFAPTREVRERFWSS